MSYLPIAKFVPQWGSAYSGYVLKAYAAGTSTNISMATSTAGTTTATSIALNAAGQPEINSNIVLPHTNQDFKLSLYPSQAAADSNTGATWTIDNIPLTDLGTSFAATETGTGDAYEILLTLVPTDYTAGQDVFFIASEANTGACSLNVNSLGARSIKMLDGSDPYDNAIVANMIAHLKDDGTNYQLMNPNIYTPAISGYVSGVTEYLEADAGADSTQVEVHSVVTTATWESIGPTGSGADNIWASMDIIPTGAKWIDIRLSLYLTSAADNKLEVFTRTNGSSATAGLDTAVAVVYNFSSSNENIVAVRVPLTSNIFDIHYTYSGTPSINFVRMRLIGFGI
jgi:hypothetical protein